MPGIRRMVQTDLEQVAVIAAGLFTQPWDRQGFADALPLESACFLVAAEGDKVLGYCGLYMAADEGEVINVAVAKASQGKGIASRLMDALLDEGHARGVHRFFLEVRVSNDAAIYSLFSTILLKGLKNRGSGSIFISCQTKMLIL